MRQRTELARTEVAGGVEVVPQPAASDGRRLRSLPTEAMLAARRAKVQRKRRMQASELLATQEAIASRVGRGAAPPSPDPRLVRAFATGFHEGTASPCDAGSAASGEAPLRAAASGSDAAASSASCSSHWLVSAPRLRYNEDLNAPNGADRPLAAPAPLPPMSGAPSAAAPAAVRHSLVPARKCPRPRSVSASREGGSEAAALSPSPSASLHSLVQAHTRAYSRPPSAKPTSRPCKYMRMPSPLAAPPPLRGDG